MKDEMSLHIEKITGKPAGDVACGTFSKKVALADSSEGTLASCIFIKAGDGADLGEATGDIFEIALKKLEMADGGVLAALSAAAKLAQNFREGLEVNLVHVLFARDVCYIVRTGDKVKLLVFDPPKSVEIKFESGSGPVLPGQIYLLATEAFLAIFDVDVLAKEARIDFGELIDGIATDIAGEENQAEIGACFAATEDTEGEIGESVGSTSAEATVDKQKTSEPVPPNHRFTDTPTHRITDSLIHRLTESPKKILSAIFLQIGKIRRGDIGTVRRNLAGVAMVFVLVLAISIGFALWQNSQRSKIAQFNSHMSAASGKYDEGLAIVELNRARARELFIEADREVKLALSIKNSDEKAKKLAGDVEQKLRETEGLESIDFSQVVDFGESINSLNFSGGSLASVTRSKFRQVNPAGGNANDTDLSKEADLGFVFDGRVFFTSGQKVYRLDVGSGQSIEAGDASGPLDIAVFASNVYVLGRDSIFKFVPIEAGYLAPSQYLNSPESFSQSSHFAVDGNIWVTSGNKILKFIRGEKESFEISGLTEGLGELSLIYTSPNLDNLYVVDGTNSALLVISKEGILVKVLQSGEFFGASDIAVDEAEQNVYVAAGSKILKASL